MNLFLVEVRRCLSRRLVWVLLMIAAVAIVVTGVLVFANTARTQPGEQVLTSVCEVEVVTPGQPPVEECRTEPGVVKPFTLTDLWPVGGGDPALAASVFFLAIGGLLGGASMIGAEWRAGTMATVLTWEPRRVRLAVAKLAAATVLAWVFAMALQVLLVLAVVPAAAAHGSTEGVDGEWLRVLAGGVFRSGAMAAFAALVGGAVAMIGRNTAAAFGAAFAYMVIGENLVRAWKPWLRPWLLAENAVIFLTGRPLNDPLVMRQFGTAAMTLLAYCVALAAVAVASLRLRDVASS
ncbi:MAG TPA: hypothetical protein VM938_10180 [Acidimicrobiales bacterium]|nr:hypothetical protein [Acidimicrobiales bacterium]